MQIYFLKLFVSLICG